MKVLSVSQSQDQERLLIPLLRCCFCLPVHFSVNVIIFLVVFTLRSIPYRFCLSFGVFSFLHILHSFNTFGHELYLSLMLMSYLFVSLLSLFAEESVIERTEKPEVKQIKYAQCVKIKWIWRIWLSECKFL